MNRLRSDTREQERSRFGHRNLCLFVAAINGRGIRIHNHGGTKNDLIPRIYHFIFTGIRLTFSQFGRNKE
jgi:hypothetical protein